MSLLSVLNAAEAALATLGVPVYQGRKLARGSQGNLKTPDDPKYYVIHIISPGMPSRQWNVLQYQAARIQVDAWSQKPGEDLTMIQQAIGVLTPLKFQLIGGGTELGNDGTYVGIAHDFERGYKWQS